MRGEKFPPLFRRSNGYFDAWLMENNDPNSPFNMEISGV